MGIPAAEGLTALPDPLSLSFEEERAAAFAERHQVAIYRARKLCAAEYGFASWENLVAYYAKWDEHARTGPSPYSLEGSRVNSEAADLLKNCNSRKHMTEAPPDDAGRLAAIATYVPRFYALSDEEISADTLTEAEAQLVVARQRRFLNWNSMLAAIEEEKPHRLAEAPNRDRTRAVFDAQKAAIGNRDARALQRFFLENPNWVQAPKYGTPQFGPVRDVIKLLIQSPGAETRAMYDVLSSVGFDVQAHLDIGLLGDEHTPAETSYIRGLLELGANPLWIAPNGHGALDHAIVRYMNGEALDLIAPLLPVTHKAFWVAAGMGDVETMLEFVSTSGVPTTAARADRPDTNTLNVARHKTRAPRPGASDREVVWEAFTLAVLNGRTQAVDALLKLGFPIDYSPIWCNALCLSVEHQLVGSVEMLMSRGANPHYKAWPSHYSPMHMSKVGMDNYPERPGVREIHAMLAGRR
ncbi:MAG: hypothetical protein ABJB74_20040 [Gemmatimonas sp.]